MKINKTIGIAVLLFGLLMGGLAAGVLFSQQPPDINAAPPAQEPATEAEDVDQAGDVEDNDANEAEDIDEAGDVEDDDGNETEEAVSPDQAGITADEAKTAAETYTGVKAIAVELENENGKVAYEVEMEDGQEVLVDAVDGTVLGVDAD